MPSKLHRHNSNSTYSKPPVPVSLPKKKKDRIEKLQDEIQKQWNGEDSVMEHVRWLKSKTSAANEPDVTEKAMSDTEISYGYVLDILGDIRDNTHKKSHERLRNTITGILKCIDTLGSKVAEGASNVFAPAPACFNALSFVMQFWIKYEDIFEKLEELFARCYTFLSRFHSYKDIMTLPLQLVACKLLRHVVKICRRSVEIKQSKWTIWKILLKDGFLGDNDIKVFMEQMEQLVVDEQSLLVAESFTQLIEIGKTIAGEETQRKVAADAQAWKRAISESLWLGDEENETKSMWKNAKKEIEKTLIPETGRWIQANPTFRAWATSPSSPNSVLVLKGGSNSGKTRLVTNIINHFESSKPRPIVGYYFHQRDSKRPLSKNKLRSSVSRSLLWQLATSRDAPTKLIARASAKMGYNPDYIDIWRQLFIDIDPLERKKSIYYVVIDGLENDIGSIIPLIYEITASQDIQVLLTAKDNVVDAYTKKQAFPFTTIELHEKENPLNMADIRKFIIDRMDSIDALKDDTSDPVKDCRDTIRTALEERTQGDYIWISTILSSLARADRATEFNDIINKIKDTRGKQIQDEIARLNKDLSEPSINDLNEVILWVAAAKELPTVNQMNAVLFLNFGPGSFIPLEQRLGPLLELNHARRVNFRSPEIKEIIPTPKSNSGTIDWAENGLVQSLDNTDTVSRFLQHVCPRRKYDNARLEEFLWKQNTPSIDLGIHYDGANAHIRIAWTCLKSLTDKKSKSTEELRMYSGSHLIHHLQNTKLAQVDEAEAVAHTDSKLLGEVGLLLIKLFTDDESIDSLFWTRAEHMSQHSWFKNEGEWLKRNRRRWLYGSEGINELVRWFKNTIVTSVMKDVDKKWVQDFVEQKERRHEILLKPAAKRLAHHLLFEDIFTSREECTAVYFLCGYVSRLPPKGGQKKPNPCSGDRTDMMLEEMLRIEEWAMSESIFGPKAEDSAPWQIQTAMTISSMCVNDDKEKINQEQTRRIERARGIDPHNLMASHTVASRLRHSNDNDEDPNNSSETRKTAIRILEQAVEEIEKITKSQPAWFETISRSLLATFIYLDLGDLYWSEGLFSVAAERYSQSLVYSSTRYSSYLDILEHYHENGKWTEVIGFIKKLIAHAKPTQLVRYLDRMIHEFIAVDLFQRVVSQAAEETNSWDTIKEPFTLAFELAKENPADLFHAHKAYISTIQRKPKKENVQDLIIHHCKQALACGVHQAESGNGVLYHDIFAIVDTLAQIYLHKAVNLLEQAYSAMRTSSSQKDPVRNGSVSATPTKANESFGASQPMPEVKRLLDTASLYAREIESMVLDTDVWMNTGVYCCFARYHLKMGDKAAARKSVELVMAAALGLLTDKDPSNDWFAFLHLGRVLNTLQDWENAQAAWEMLQPDTDELLFTCYVCRELITFGVGDRICTDCCGPIYVHRGCYNDMPLADIFAKTITGDCYKHHKFIELCKDQRQANAAGCGKIWTGTEEVTIEVWKERLTLRYLLEGVDAGPKGNSPSYLQKGKGNIPERTNSPTKNSRRDKSSPRVWREMPGPSGSPRGPVTSRGPTRNARGPTRNTRGSATPRPPGQSQVDEQQQIALVENPRGIHHRGGQ